MAPLSDDEIQKRFGKHAAAIEGPNPNEPVHALLRQHYVEFAQFLEATLSDSRDKSLALTSLEEASMWSHKAAGRETYEIVDLGSTDPLTFEQELIKLINKHGLERYSNTADWIIARCFMMMLEAFDLGFTSNDEEDEYAVLDFAARAVRALDVGVRLRERQGRPRAEVQEILEEGNNVPPVIGDEAQEALDRASDEHGPLLDISEAVGKTVPLIDRTGETPQVVGHATVVEKADGFHIEGVIPDLPEGLKPVSLGYHAGPVPLLEHFGLNPNDYNLSKED